MLDDSFTPEPFQRLLTALMELPPPQRSLRALHAALDGISLPLTDTQRAQLLNCNTPEQWRELGR